MSNNRHLTLSLVIFLGFILSGCNNSEAKPVHFGADKPPVQANKIDPSGFRFVISKMAKKVMPIVVSIKSTKTISRPSYGNPFWDEFFFGPQNRRMPNQAPLQKQQGLGSGVIVSSDGYIQTEPRDIFNTLKVITISSHHLTHASSALHLSPFEQAIIVSYDVGGYDGHFNVYL